MLVTYHSVTDNTEKMAQAVATGPAGDIPVPDADGALAADRGGKGGEAIPTMLSPGSLGARQVTKGLVSMCTTVRVAIASFCAVLVVVWVSSAAAQSNIDLKALAGRWVGPGVIEGSGSGSVEVTSGGGPIAEMYQALPHGKWRLSLHLRVDGDKILFQWMGGTGTITISDRGGQRVLLGTTKTNEGTDTGWFELSPAPAEQIVQSAATNRPTLYPRDVWQFSDGRRITVVATSEQGYTLDGYWGSWCPSCLSRFEADALVEVFRSDRQPFKTGHFAWFLVGPEWGWPSFPLHVGKEWQNSGKGYFRNDPVFVYANTLVKSHEDVTTKAGRFKAYRLERTWRRKIVSGVLDFGEEHRDTWWYAPDAKIIIKHVSRGREWELTSYVIQWP